MLDRLLFGAWFALFALTEIRRDVEYSKRSGTPLRHGAAFLAPMVLPLLIRLVLG